MLLCNQQTTNNHTEIIIGLLTFIATILIPLLIFIWKIYFTRPQLTIEINWYGGRSLPRGLSYKNPPGDLEDDKAIRIFELSWRFDIVIRNNSDNIAFYPELEFNPKGPKFTEIDILNRLLPIKPAESLTLKAEYRKFEESTGQNRTQIGRIPPVEFNDLEILLGYENSKKIRFYTLYNHNIKNDNYKFLKNKPTDYKTN